jgi:hypothetical protein
MIKITNTLIRPASEHEHLTSNKLFYMWAKLNIWKKSFKNFLFNNKKK